MSKKRKVENGKKVYPVGGRDENIDLDKYMVTVRGRKIVDYEKLKADNPALYHKILRSELGPDEFDKL